MSADPEEVQCTSLLRLIIKNPEQYPPDLHQQATVREFQAMEDFNAFEEAPWERLTVSEATGVLTSR